MVTYDGDEEASEPETYSSSSSDSESRIDTLIDNIIANFSLYSPDSDNPIQSQEMTIKNKSKKERNKHERPERHERHERDSIDRPGTSGASRFSFGYTGYNYSTAENTQFGRPPRAAPCIRSNEVIPDVPEELDTESYSFSHFPATESSSFTHPYTPHGHSHSHKRRLWNATQGHEKACKQACDRRTTSASAVLQHVEEGSGNNSEDEYYIATGTTRPNPTDPASDPEKDLERLLMEKKGWRLVRVGMDGACLFRAVSNQIFGDEEKHNIIRSQVLDYMIKNREHFSQYMTEDYDHYITRKKDLSCHGNHLEIQAIAELYNRPVEIYHDSAEPINVFHSEYKTEAPIRLSYHGQVHYNAVIDPFNPCVGIGLGMPNYQPGLPEPDLIEQALAESENVQIEQAMLHDKLKETEKHDVERGIEEQVARESYLEYLSQFKPRRNSGKTRVSSPLHPTTSCKRTPPRKSDDLDDPPPAPLVSCSSTSPSSSSLHLRPEGEATSLHSVPAPVRGAACGNLQTSSRPDSPAGACAGSSSDLPDGAQASAGRMDGAIVRHMPAEMLDMDEDAVMALVMEESRREYLESLKAKNTSPSTQHGAVGGGTLSPTDDNQRPGCSKDT